jgi:hypothetical protein
VADHKNETNQSSPSPSEAEAAARAHKSRQRREDDLRAAALNARTRAKAAPVPAPGPSLGDGYRLQNISDQPIDGIEPGAVFDVSHWSQLKLDRVAGPPTARRADLLVLGPDDQARVLEEPELEEPELEEPKAS